MHIFKELSIKPPELPPKTGDDASSKFWRELEAKLLPLEDQYLHWDQLRQKQIPIVGVNHKQWWQLLKAKRRARTQALPFVNYQGLPYYWVLDDRLVKKLMAVERYLRTQLEPVFNQCVPCEAFLSEAVMSLLLSGASIDTDAALDLLSTGRPATAGEQPVLNHYAALMELFAHSTHALDDTLLQRMWSATVGRSFTADDWRTDDAPVVYSIDGIDIIRTPLPRAGIPEQLKKLYAFANQPDEDYPGFMHPIIKALLLNYRVIEDRPFKEANSRVANALFYWQLLKSGYSVLASVSSSAVIAEQLSAYYQHFLYVESDDNDLTYFLLQQLDVLLIAMTRYHDQLRARLTAHAQMTEQTGTQELNPRQLTILYEMRTHPEREYRLATYKQRFDVTYETSRTDLMQLARQKLAKQHKIGKAFVYSAN